MASEHDVIVVGGGLAGIAASVVLARRGVRVCLLEARRRLGGRASSFVDAASGEVLDNGQHVTMGCCHAYLRLLELLGKSETLEWFDRQTWIEPGGRRSQIEPAWGTAWLHDLSAFAPSMLRVQFLTLGERIQVARAVAQLMVTQRADYVGTTFHAWLFEQGQSPRVVERFWTPIVVSACNLHPRDVSASSAMHVFQDGIGRGAESARIGVSRVPLAALYDRVAEELASAGGEVVLGAMVEHVSHRTVRTPRDIYQARHVICALPPEKATDVVDASLQHGDWRFDAMRHVSHSAIVCVHLELSEGSIDLPHAVLLETTTQWLFRKDAAGRRLAVVVSAAGELVARSDGEIAAIVERDLRACFPDRGIRVGPCRAVRERRATFAATPAWEARRPTTLGPHGCEGLLLAGEYVATGWPATMESATRSGFAAAEVLLGK